jgi:hypothetical protein
MNIEMTISNAYRHFTQHYAGGIDSELIFTQYAIDELGMSKPAAEEFASKAMDAGKEEDFADTGEYNRFYTWYYLNYVIVPEENIPVVAEPVPMINWRVDLRRLTSDAMLEDISVLPQCSMVRDGKIVYETCFPDNAEIWSVFVHTVTGSPECMADCKNKFTADYLAGLLKKIIGLWQVNILVDIKEASIQQVFSSHPIRLATVDRDVLESGEENAQLDLVREEYIATNARVGEFYQAIPIYDKEDELVRARLKQAEF